MSFKILNGTPKSGKSLCDSCSYCGTVKGQNLEEIKTCAMMMFGFSSMMTVTSGITIPPGVITMKVAECSRYQDMNRASLEDMKKIAWDVEPRKRGSVGFGQGATNPDELEMVITPPNNKDARSK